MNAVNWLPSTISGEAIVCPFGNERIGAGKTTIGIAIAEYLHTTQARENRDSAYPALVVGPGIVTGKENWPKEIPEVIPGANSRVITIGARPLPKPVKIGVWLKGEIALTLDDTEFEQLKAEGCSTLVLKLAREPRKAVISATGPRSQQLLEALAKILVL